MFVGRAAESAQLEALLRRAPVAVVRGLGGLGKTALVLHTLHEAFPEQVARTVMIGVRPGDSHEQLCAEVARALAEARGLPRLVLSGALSDPDALLATAIDLADEGGLWVVLDDLHHADPTAVRSLLRNLVAYAREARWLATSRLDPLVPELLGQEIALPAMSDADLRRLGAACAPHLGDDAIARAARVAGGSPWRMRQALSGAAHDGDGAGLLHDLPDGAAAFLQALALFDLPLHPETLSLVAPLPAPEVRAALERRGLLEPSAAGLRVHDAARALLGSAGPGSSALRERAATALAGSSDAAGVIEAIRLLIADRRLDDAAAAIDRRLRDLIAAGLAPRLWQLVEPLGDARFAAVKLHLAVEIGGGAALAWAAGLDAPSAPHERVPWLRALLLHGRIADAAALAEDLSRAAAATPIGFEAALVRAGALVLLGDPRGALAALDTIDGAPAGAAARRDALRAKALVMSGRHADGIRIVNDLGGRLADLDPSDLREVQEARASVLMNTGRCAASAAVIAPRGGDGGATFVRSPRTQVQRSLLAMEGGRLEEGRALLARVEPLLSAASPLRLVGQMNEIRRRMSAGEFQDVDRLVDDTLAAAEASRNADMYQWAMVGRLYLAIQRATPPAAIRWAEHMPPPAGPQAPYIAAFQRLHALRAGESIGPSAWPPPQDLPDIIDVLIVSRMGASQARLLAGDGPRAIAEANAAIDLARTHGWALWEAETRFSLCEILLVLGRDDELRAAAAEASSQAATLASARHDADAAFFTMAASDHPLDAAQIEVFATLVDVAPVVARRARRCLSPSAPADTLDRAVVEALARRAGGARIVTIQGDEAAHRPGWGLDPARREAWLPSGRRVDLAQNPLFWRILDTIARDGGVASKDALARAAWELDDYHPLRDDKRMHVAVRRLRMLLEDVPSRPARLVTTADGYGFGAGQPVRLVEPGPAR